jgi:hypothetical protein
MSRTLKRRTMTPMPTMTTTEPPTVSKMALSVSSPARRPVPVMAAWQIGSMITGSGH